MKLYHSLTLYTKISSKLFKDLNVRLEIIYLLEENIGRTLSDINYSNIFFSLSLRQKEIKTKINKLNLLKFKSVCTPKETINRTKIQPTDWEKIFANDVTNKGLVSKIYKQLMMLNSIKANNPIKKWAEDLNKPFSKEYIQVAKRHMGRYSTSLIIRGMQIKTSMTYHLVPIRMTIIENPQTINAEDSVERREPSSLLVEM